LLLLAANIGLPYFVLSSTGPLMQKWFSGTHPGVSPYRLYALSNTGSLLALLSYPFFFETHFTRITQATLWGCGLVVYAFCLVGCALKVWRAQAAPAVQPTDSGPSGTCQGNGAFTVTVLQRALWLLLSACASVLLLAVTNRLCHDVAVMPFLWVLPLALYLLSFIICFDNPRWYVRVPFALAYGVAAMAICWAILRDRNWSFERVTTVYMGAFFVCCMVCHGELFRLRPDPRHLTGYYLMIAAGGALGSLFVALIAPLIFVGYIEMQVGMLVCGVSLLIVCLRDRPETGSEVPGCTQKTPSKHRKGSGAARAQTPSPASPGLNPWRWLSGTLPWVVLAGTEMLLATLTRTYPPKRMWFVLMQIGLPLILVGLSVFWVLWHKRKNVHPWFSLASAWMVLGTLVLGITFWLFREQYPQLLEARRNFYGVLRVLDVAPGDPKGHCRVLYNGRIEHGGQFMNSERASWPTTYYAEESGVGLALRSLPESDRRIGVVGLGVGTLATYARAGDTIRFYDIDPDVEHMARTHFTYLANCKGNVEVVIGDARLSLEREPPQQFDALLLDAFSGDAVPAHLLTREAFALYQRHLKPNGVFAVHISNRHLNLEPIMSNLARDFKYRYMHINSDATPGKPWTKSSRWVLLTRNDAFVDSIVRKGKAADASLSQLRTTNVPLWTDDFTSLYPILK
ncbi:MAG: fused MFS/spermidine synthase, partial [bacterium]